MFDSVNLGTLTIDEQNKNRESVYNHNIPQLLPHSFSLPKRSYEYEKDGSYYVKIKSGVLYRRRAPGIKGPIFGQLIGNDRIKIIEESFGVGSSKWGKLENNQGWVALDDCVRVSEVK